MEVSCHCQVESITYDVHRCAGSEALCYYHEHDVWLIIPNTTILSVSVSAVLIYVQRQQRLELPSTIIEVNYAGRYDDEHYLCHCTLMSPCAALCERYRNKRWSDLNYRIFEQLFESVGYPKQMLNFTYAEPVVIPERLQFETQSDWWLLSSILSVNQQYFFLTRDGQVVFFIDINHLPITSQNFDQGLIQTRETCVSETGRMERLTTNSIHWAVGQCVVLDNQRYVVANIKHHYTRDHNKTSRAYHNIIQMDSNVQTIADENAMTSPFHSAKLADHPQIVDAFGQLQTQLSGFPTEDTTYCQSLSNHPQWTMSWGPNRQVLTAYCQQQFLILGQVQTKTPQSIIYQHGDSRFCFEPDGILLSSQQHQCHLSARIVFHSSQVININVKHYRQTAREFHVFSGTDRCVVEHASRQSRFGCQSLVASQLSLNWQSQQINTKVFKIHAESVRLQHHNLRLQADGVIACQQLSANHQDCALVAESLMMGNHSVGLSLSSNGQLNVWGKTVLMRAQALNIHASVETQPQPGLRQVLQRLRSRVFPLKHYHLSSIALAWSDALIRYDQPIQCLARLHQRVACEVLIYHCQSSQTVFSYTGAQFQSHETRLLIDHIHVPASQPFPVTWTCRSTPEVDECALSYWRFSIRIEDRESLVLSPPLILVNHRFIKLNNRYDLPIRSLHVYVKTLERMAFNRVQVVDKTQVVNIVGERVELNQLPVNSLLRLVLPGVEVDDPPHGYAERFNRLLDHTPISLRIHMPAIIVNARCGVTQLTPHQLAYFHAHGQIATVLVHGFNVPHGEFAKACIDEADELSAFEGELPRQQHYDPNGSVHSTGACYWLVKMEYLLNQVCLGSEYKRMILFSWPGDRAPRWDFIQAEHNADHAANDLVRLIIQCQLEGIRLNLIGHSLGCRVIVSALAQIAPLYSNAIEQVVLWQAAIPNTALCPVKPTSGVSSYHRPTAYQACRQLIILHSQNDNILGPITTSSARSDKPWQERIFPRLLTQADLSSLYELAEWLGESPQQLMTAQGRRQFYQHFIRLHPVDRDGHRYPATFAQALHQYGDQNDMFQQLTELERLQQHVLQTSNSWLELQLASQVAALRFQLEHYRLYPEIHALQQVIMTCPFQPTPALGWFGPDPTTRRLLAQRATVVDQGLNLAHHSAMLEPSPALYQQVFEEVFARLLKI